MDGRNFRRIFCHTVVVFYFCFLLVYDIEFISKTELFVLLNMQEVSQLTWFLLLMQKCIKFWGSNCIFHNQILTGYDRYLDCRARAMNYCNNCRSLFREKNNHSYVCMWMFYIYTHTFVYILKCCHPCFHGCYQNWDKHFYILIMLAEHFPVFLQSETFYRIACYQIVWRFFKLIIPFCLWEEMCQISVWKEIFWFRFLYHKTSEG